jgi:hypothetical protein
MVYHTQNYWVSGFFFHCPVFYGTENTTFRKMNLFPSSYVGGGTPTQLGFLKTGLTSNTGLLIEVSSVYGAQLSRCLPPTPEEGNRHTFRNIVFSSS